MKIAAAAALYFLTVFGVGFLLGPIRVLLLEPRLGPVAAVLCEAPFILTAIVAAARWAPRLMGLKPRSGSMLSVGLGALVLLLACDFAVGRFLRGFSAQEQVARFATTEGLIYATLLVVFAVMPMLANRTAEGREKRARGNRL